MLGQNLPGFNEETPWSAARFWLAVPVNVEPVSEVSAPPETGGLAQRSGLGAWLGCLGVALLLIVLRWNSYNAPLIRDEGEYAYAAGLLQHGVAPYEHAFLQKPPMVVYTYALAHLLAPSVFWSARLLAALCVATATVLLGLIARLEFGPGVALPAVWFFTPMVLLPGLEQFTANTEMFMLLPLLGLLTTYVLGRRPSSGPGTWFLAGCFGAVTFLYKYTALPVLLFIYISWAIEDWRAQRQLGPLARRWLWGAAGAFVASVAVLGFFLLHDGCRHLWECTVQFNSFYFTSNDFALAAVGQWLLHFFKPWWVLFLLPWAGFLRPAPRIWFWLGVFAAAWLGTATSYYGQYYILPMAFWALLCAVALAALAAWIAGRSRLPEAWIRRAFTIVVVALLCWPDVLWLTLSPSQFAEARLATENPFREAPLVARRVSELTSPQDPVLVAGSEPEILCYANRLSPTRFVITAPLMIPSPLAAGFQEEIIRDLTQRPPPLVVLVRPNSSWLMQEDSPKQYPLFLVDFLAANYDRIGGYVTSPNRHWEEPLPEENVLHSSLIVFRKK